MLLSWSGWGGVEGRVAWRGVKWLVDGLALSMEKHRERGRREPGPGSSELRMGCTWVRCRAFTAALGRSLPVGHSSISFLTCASLTARTVGPPSWRDHGDRKST